MEPKEEIKRKELIPVRDANVSISKTAMSVAGMQVITKNQQKVVVSANMTIDLRYGDTIEQMKLIPDKSIDAIICDLP